VVKTSLPDSELKATFHCTRAQIDAYVYTDVAVKADETIARAFDRLNARLLSRRLKEYYNATRFRLVYPPQMMSRGTEIELALAPIDFACVALLRDPKTSNDVRRYLMSRITKRERKLPKLPRSRKPSFDFRNYDLLGTQICLITADGKTLFRQRGGNVLFAKHRWDVSVSGFCGELDLIESDRLDPALTVEHETRRELATLRGDPRQIYFTGLHRNTNTGAIDLLVYWKIEATSQELAEVIGVGEGTRKGVFRTRRKAIEPYVWDTKNLIVRFDAKTIKETFKACQIGALDFEPQSLLCIELALRALKGQSLGIEIGTSEGGWPRSPARKYSPRRS